VSTRESETEQAPGTHEIQTKACGKCPSASSQRNLPITGAESSDLLAVLHELNTNTLADSRVGLLGLNAELLHNNALGVGSTTEGVSLEGGAKVGLLVALVGPSVDTTDLLELARSADTTGLAKERVSPVERIGTQMENRRNPMRDTAPTEETHTHTHTHKISTETRRGVQRTVRIDSKDACNQSAAPTPHTQRRGLSLACNQRLRNGKPEQKGGTYPDPIVVYAVSLEG
jgi:hypothetical protein